MRKIERYLKERGMSATAFGEAVARDPRLVMDLRRGRQPGQRLVSKIDAFIGSGR